MGVAYIRIYSEVSKVFEAYRKSAVVTGDDLSGTQQKVSKTVNQDSKHQDGHRPSRVAINPGKETNETTGTVESMRPSVDEESQRPPKMLKKGKLREEEAKQIALLMQSVAIVGVFLMGWTPFLFATVYEIITGTKAHPDFEFAGEMFVSMNDLLNPVVVMVFDDKIRRNVVQFFSCAED
ncbi:hypothetical protein BJ741DRAFT_601233, partial [Chytriomyces cf. hyalinus JEL632]